MRASGTARQDDLDTDNPPLFGWHEAAPGAADGAVLQTPPFPGR